jgi:hypothetical protein
MKITLRKAAAIQTGINDVLKSIEFETTAKLNEFQDPESKISETHVGFLKALARKEELTAALYDIRKAVSRANAAAGVDQMLAEIAFFDKMIAMYQGLAKLNVRENPAVLAGRLDKIRNTKEERYSLYGRDELASSIFVQEDLDSFATKAADLKRRKTSMQDMLLEMNVSTEVQLNDTTISILSTVGLL